MRKLMALTLAALMILSAVPAALAEETDYSQLPKYTFDWTTYFVAPPAENTVIINKIEEKFNVDINILPIEDSNFLEVLNTYIMGGDTPDVIRLKDPGVFLTYVDQGVLGEIDIEVLKEHAPMIYQSIQGYADGSFWSYGAVDGVQYGIPAIAGGNLFHLPIVYNKTWMEAVGVENTPKTLEELEDLLRKFTFEDPDGDGQQNTYGVASDGLRNLFGAYGVNPGAADGRTDHSYFQLIDGQVEYAAATRQYQEALKVAARWYKEGLIDPEFITGENTGGYWAISHSLINHRIGMTVRGNYYHWTMPGLYQEYNAEGELVDNLAGSVATEFLNVNPDEVLVFGDPVEGPYGSGVKSWNMLAQFYVFSPEVTSDPDKFARVCAIMEYMDRQYSADVEIRQQYYEDIYGEEGNYWYWMDKEALSMGTTDLYKEKYPEFAPIDEFGPTQWGPQLPTAQTSRAAQYAYSLGYDQKGIVNLVQFSLPQMSLDQKNLTNLKDSWMIDFITGKKDIEADWNAYLQEMNASGLEAMVQEVREWYANSQSE